MELCAQTLATKLSAGAHRPLCHCLNVMEAEVREAIADHDLHSVRGVAKVCGAGGGCTACHRHIKRLLNEHAVECRMNSLAHEEIGVCQVMSFAEFETVVC